MDELLYFFFVLVDEKTIIHGYVYDKELFKQQKNESQPALLSEILKGVSIKTDPRNPFGSATGA